MIYIFIIVFVIIWAVVVEPYSLTVKKISIKDESLKFDDKLNDEDVAIKVERM